MKTLVVIAHPTLEESKVNASWMKELERYPEEFTIHNLYEVSKNAEFNVEEEQKLIKNHDKLVLQFPVYWFNCPPLMKKWLDEVFLEGWAYGKKNQMKNHKVGLIVSAGIRESDYSEKGRYKFTLEEVLRPFEVTFNYMESNYKGFYAFYSAEHESTEDKINESLSGMKNFIGSI